MYMELLPGSGSGIIVPDPANSERANLFKTFRSVNSLYCT